MPLRGHGLVRLALHDNTHLTLRGQDPSCYLLHGSCPAGRTHNLTSHSPGQTTPLEMIKLMSGLRAWPQAVDTERYP